MCVCAEDLPATVSELALNAVLVSARWSKRFLHVGQRGFCTLVKEISARWSKRFLHVGQRGFCTLVKEVSARWSKRFLHVGQRGSCTLIQKVSARWYKRFLHVGQVGTLVKGFAASFELSGIIDAHTQAGAATVASCL